ncbi:hypothetical protein AB0D09_40905 [Streptomyces sp. NPDC049097]|uniref:hypothetical protein n=1 Tax=Streptomyces sp. NPDC049097 TaxID=3155497 RepID=UPI0034399548
MIYREQTGESEKVDVRQEDGGCQDTLDRLAVLKPGEFTWIRTDDPREDEL